MANDPALNIAGNVDPDMMGSHSGIGFLYGRNKRNQQRSRQFSEDRRLIDRRAKAQADLMTHAANVSDWEKRRAAGVDSDEEVRAAGGLDAASIASQGKATMEHVVNPMQASHQIMGPNGQLEARQGFSLSLPGGVRYGTNQYQARQEKTEPVAKRLAPENERPTHAVNPADTNPMAGRQFTLDSDVQGVYDLRTSPKGKQTKGAGKARAMEWGPLSAEDKAMDARRATPAQAVEAENSTGEATPERKVARAKDATRAGASVSATGSAVYPPLKSK